MMFELQAKSYAPSDASWASETVAPEVKRKPRASLRKGHTFLEFFAGGGMARAGLGKKWNCVFANDFDPMKADAYRKNWKSEHLVVKDINLLSPSDIPGQADLAWASFPCQDLSLAGNYEGIGHWADNKQTRSGTFWPFWQLMRGLSDAKRAPRTIVLENVYGALTSNEGRDFAAISDCFATTGYQFGAMVIDARHFLPHSRPRVFMVAVRGDLNIPPELTRDTPTVAWHPNALLDAYQNLPDHSKTSWIWWNLPKPSVKVRRFADLIEDEPQGVNWNSDQETQKLIGMMSSLNLAKIETAKSSEHRMVGAVYKRTRVEGGVKVQRAEVRFDDVAGCLRTPSGGSSRQSIIVVDGSHIKSRLLSPREAARLMGLPEDYRLPSRYNDAYHLAGDGVAIPVVRHLAASILEPILAAN